MTEGGKQNKTLPGGRYSLPRGAHSGLDNGIDDITRAQLDLLGCAVCAPTEARGCTVHLRGQVGALFDRLWIWVLGLRTRRHFGPNIEKWSRVFGIEHAAKNSTGWRGVAWIAFSPGLKRKARTLRVNGLRSLLATSFLPPSARSRAVGGVRRPSGLGRKF